MLEDEEADDFGMADGMGNMEGARIDSGLYDMYNNRMVAPPTLASRAPRPPGAATEGFRPDIYERQFTMPFPRPMPTYTSVFGSQPTAVGVPHTHAFRTARPARVRRPPGGFSSSSWYTNDFSDFTARRRTARRLSARQEAAADREDNNATPRPSDAAPAPVGLR